MKEIIEQYIVKDNGATGTCHFESDGKNMGDKFTLVAGRFKPDTMVQVTVITSDKVVARPHEATFIRSNTSKEETWFLIAMNPLTCTFEEIGKVWKDHEKGGNHWKWEFLDGDVHCGISRAQCLFSMETLAAEQNVFGYAFTYVWNE
jgi:hypothetical protein